MSAVLAGIKVLDISSGPAVGLATMVLADFGAEVLVIDNPSGDFFLDLPAAPMWRRGKQSLKLDIERERETLLSLCAAADIVVTDLTTQTSTAAGLSAEQLREQFPGLIYCQVSGFGHTGPMAHLPGYEHLVAAASGRMLLFQGTTDRSGPVFSALQVGIHATAQSTVTGILSALFRKHQHGCGSTVRTSLLQGMLPYEQGGTIGQQFPERFGHLLPTSLPADAPTPTLFYHPMQAADGKWLQSGNLLPHLFDNFLMVTDLIEVLADPDFDGKQLTMPEPKLSEFRERMLHRIQSKPVDEWMTEAIANGGVVAGKYQTSQEALEDPDIIANGHVIERQGGVQLGPIARLSETPANPGEVCTSASAEHWLGGSRDHNAGGEPDELPLAGVKVLELATIIAAPMGASFLADLGAEVTKIEQVGGDPYRGFSFGIGSARVNAGKRSICLNLKSPAAQQVVQELVKTTDILIHNYRPGVPEKLGFGYDTLKAINPKLIYLQCNGYGPDGPGVNRPCTHPIPGASMGGVVYQMGGSLPDELLSFDEHVKWASRIMRANEVNPDPNTALVVASAALMGLTARSRHGISQQIFVDMFGANAYANHDDFLSYPGKQARALQDEGLHGLSPTYRLYSCAEEQWLFLAIPQLKEQEKFCNALRAHDLADLGIDELDAETLAELFAQHTADAWQMWLQADGLGVARADAHQPSRYWLDDEQAQALHLTYPATHPVWGDYQRHGANVTLDGIDWSLAPPPTAGQQSREILVSLGYSDEMIDELFDDGAVWQEEIA